MFLTNYYNLMRALHSGATYGPVINVENNSENSPELSRISFANTTGTYAIYTCSLLGISNGTTHYAGTGTWGDANQCGVIIGDGDTPSALSDHGLSGNMITSFSATTSVSCTTSNGEVWCIGTYAITNTGSVAFTIKEIACSRGTSNGKRCIITRDLLEVPLTIEPGATETLVYKIKIS